MIARIILLIIIMMSLVIFVTQILPVERTRWNIICVLVFLLMWLETFVIILMGK